LLPRLLFFGASVCVHLHKLVKYTLYTHFSVWCKMINNIRIIFYQICVYMVNGRTSNCFLSSALRSSVHVRAAFLELVLKLIIKGRHLLCTAHGSPLGLLFSFPWERVALQKIIFMVSQSREPNTSELISLEHQYHLNVGFGTFWMQGEKLNQSASTSLYSFCFKQE